MPIINVEGVGNVQFPDGLSPEELTQAVNQVGEPALRERRKADIRAELSPEAMAKFEADQSAQWDADNNRPSVLTEGPRRLAAGVLRLVEAPLRLGAEYKAAPAMWIPGVADATKRAADSLEGASKILDPGTEVRYPDGTARSAGDVWDTYKKAGPVAGALALGELGVGAVLDNLPQLVPAAATAKLLQGAGLTAKAATRLAPLISTAPLETADALKEYQDAGADPLRAKLIAPVVGAVNAALETVGDSALLERAFMPEAKGAARFILGQFLKEATTEAAQEGTTMAGRIPAGADPVSRQEAMDRILTAGIAGGLSGAGIGGGIEVARRASTPQQQLPQPPQPNAPQTEVQQTAPQPQPQAPPQAPPQNPFEAIAQNTVALDDSVKRLAAKLQTDAGLNEYVAPAAVNGPIDNYVKWAGGQAPQGYDAFIRRPQLPQVQALGQQDVESGLGDYVAPDLIPSPIDQFIRRTQPERDALMAQAQAEAERRQRKANVEAGLTAPMAPRQIKQQVGQYPSPGPDENAVVSQPEQPAQQDAQQAPVQDIPPEHAQLIDAVANVASQFNAGKEVDMRTLIGAIEAGQYAKRILEGNIARREEAGRSDATPELYQKLEAVDSMLTKYGERFTKKGVTHAPQEKGRQETLLAPEQQLAPADALAEQYVPEFTGRLSGLIQPVAEDGNEVQKVAAKRIQELGIDVPVRVVSREQFISETGIDRPGAYKYQTGEILIQKRAYGSGYTILHEGVHASLSRKLEDDRDFSKQATKLRYEIQGHLGVEDYGLQDHGSEFSNNQEFLTEALSNPEFQAKLKKIKPPGQELTLWQKLIEFFRKALGMQPNQRNMLDEVLSLAIPAFSQPKTTQQSTSFAPRVYSSTGQIMDDIRRPGITLEGKQEVVNRASAQATMIPEHIATEVSSLSKPDPTLTQYDNRIRKRIGQLTGWLAEQFHAIEYRSSITTLPQGTEEEIEKKRAVAQGMLMLDFAIKNAAEKLDERTMDKVLPAMERARMTLEKARSMGVKASLIKAMRERMADEFGEYIDSSAQVGSSLTDQENQALRRATDKLANVRKKIGIDPAEVDKALAHIAYQIPQAVLANMQTPEEVLGYVVQNNVFGNAQDIPADTVDFLTYKVGTKKRAPLESFRGLIPALKRIQRITDDKQAAELTIEAFERKWAQIHSRAKNAEGKDKPVAFRDFITQYKRLLSEESEAADIARALSRKFEALDIEIRAREQAKDLYGRTMVDPGYQRELTAALDAAGALDPVLAPIKAHTRGSEDKTKANTLRYYVGGEAFDISWSLDPWQEDKNLQAVTDMLRAIDEQLAIPTLSPTNKRTYENLKSYADMWLNHIGNSESFGGLRMNSFDLVNKLRTRLAALFPFLTRDFVVRLMPGRLRADALLLASATNAVRKGIDAALLHPTFGQVAHALKIQDAIDSHPGLGQQRWDREVLNPILDAGQSLTGVPYEVGDLIPETGHIVTAEDMAAARINSKFSNAVTKVVTGASGMSGVITANPQLIEDDKTKLLRKPVKDGPLMSPRSLNRGTANDATHSSADNWIQEWKLAKADGATSKLMDQDWFYTNVVLPHAVASNPEYDRKSAYEQAYRQLTVEYRKHRRDIPSTLDELVNEVLSLTDIPDTETEESMRKKIRADITSEIDRVISSVDSKINGNDQETRKRLDEDLAGLGLTSTDERMKLINNETLVQVLDSQSSFTTGRGRMLAPASFYTYSLASDAAKGAYTKAAIMPFHRRELRLLEDSVRALDTEEKRLRDMVEQGLTTDAKIRADVQSGKLYSDLNQINLLKTMLGGVFSLYRDSVVSGATHANRDQSFLEVYLGVDRSLLLAQPTAAISNLVNAMSAGKVVPYWMMGLKRNALGNAALLIPSNVYTAVVRAAAGTEAGKWMVKNRKNLMWGMRQFAQHLERATVASMVARASGVAPERMRFAERVNAIRKLGTTASSSPVLMAGQRTNNARKAGEVMAKIPGMAYVSAAVTDITRMADRYGNISSIDNSMEALRTLFLATFQAMEARSKSGVPGWNDWSNPANALKPAEIKAAGFGDESMSMVRQLLAPAGGFERAAYDFWVRTKDMHPSDRAVATPIANEGALHDVLDQLLGFINLPLISNRPDVLRGESWLGRVLKSVTTFPGWISEWMGVLSLMMATSTKRPKLNRAAYSALALLMVGVLMAFIGMSAIEPRRLVYETVQGRIFPTLTPRSLLDDMSPGTALKVLGASLASSIPYIGEMAADLMGAPTYRSSATDLSSMSRSLSLASDLKSTFEYGWKTGDTVGMIGQLLRSAAPIGSMFWNRVPAFAERNAVADATRAARVAAGDLEVQQTGGRGGSGEPSQFSSLIRRAVAAEIGGDTDGARSFIQEARALKVEAGVADPDTAIKAALASQMPDRKAFGRTLEESEEASLIGRMSGRQKFSYMAGKTAVTQLLGSMPTRGKRVKKSPGLKGLRLGGASKLKLKQPKLKLATARSARPRMPRGFAWPNPGQGLRLGI